MTTTLQTVSPPTMTTPPEGATVAPLSVIFAGTITDQIIKEVKKRGNYLSPDLTGPRSESETRYWENPQMRFCHALIQQRMEAAQALYRGLLSDCIMTLNEASPSSDIVSVDVERLMVLPPSWEECRKIWEPLNLAYNNAKDYHNWAIGARSFKEEATVRRCGQAASLECALQGWAEHVHAHLALYSGDWNPYAKEGAAQRTLNAAFHAWWAVRQLELSGHDISASDQRMQDLILSNSPKNPS